jgi:predicted membrane chloride channel (bestrophin family)
MLQTALLPRIFNEVFVVACDGIVVVFLDRKWYKVGYAVTPPEVLSKNLQI